MKKKALIWFVSAAVCTIASAQSGDPFYGTWKVSWKGPSKTQEAKLVLNKERGTWQTYGGAKENPCVGREVPAYLAPSSDSEAVVTLKFSEALAGCSDDKIRMVLTAPNSAAGTRGKTQLTLVKD